MVNITELKRTPRMSPQQSLKMGYFIDGKMEDLIKEMARCEAMKLGT